VEGVCDKKKARKTLLELRDRDIGVWILLENIFKKSLVTVELKTA
jgi:hypothetical protein